jgi:hypothetical protein
MERMRRLKADLDVVIASARRTVENSKELLGRDRL